jgi:hypothetical protein
MEAVGPSVMRHHRYLRGRPDAKGKTGISSYSKLARIEPRTALKSGFELDQDDAGPGLIAAPASTIATATAISAAAATIAGGAAATVGRASGTVAGKPASQREAVIRRIRIAVAAAAVAACPGARPRGAVLQMGHQGITNHADGTEGDQGIGQGVHRRLPGLKASASTNWSHPANTPFIDHSSEIWNFGRKIYVFL